MTGCLAGIITYPFKLPKVLEVCASETPLACPTRVYP